MEKYSGRKLKVLRTDNGGEYTSIERRGSAPRTHSAQDTRTKRRGGKIKSNACGNDQNRLWAEALATAAYLRNRCPTKAVDGMTPHEAWTSVKPTVKHFRVFGCDAFVHIPRDERHKLDSKMGYGEGY